MKKIHAAAISVVTGFLLMFTYLAWAGPLFVLLGIAVMIWGRETGPDTWEWSFGKKK
ncbi:MAG: hypothetical protein QMC96_13110 [Methanomicrobiales archaeon]|nr:hypothetical protein [Methanomicrobiales archaeon]